MKPSGPAEGIRMNVPIRMLGIANLIFWIILGAFIASAGYSLKDVAFDIGDPEFNTTASGDVALSLPFYVDNNGYYTLREFNITTVIYGEGGTELSRASTLIPAISKGPKTKIVHNATLNIKQLAENSPQFLLNDSNLNAKVAAGFDFAELMPVKLSTNLTFPWGAPFHNLALGQPQYSVLDGSNAGVSIPLSFENHATFELAGAILAKLYGSSGELLAESQIPLFVAAQSGFAGKFTFSMPANVVPQSSSRGGHVEIFFSTSLFEYGPVVYYG